MILILSKLRTDMDVKFSIAPRHGKPAFEEFSISSKPVSGQQHGALFHKPRRLLELGIAMLQSITGYMLHQMLGYIICTTGSNIEGMFFINSLLRPSDKYGHGSSV
jgi:hypothetical protein